MKEYILESPKNIKIVEKEELILKYHYDLINLLPKNWFRQYVSFDGIIKLTNGGSKKWEAANSQTNKLPLH